MQIQHLSLVIAGLATGVLASGPWEQCGGKSWTGSTSCESGWTCQKQNDYYSQCLQSSGDDDDDDTCDDEPPATAPSSTADSGPPPSTPSSSPPENKSTKSSGDSGDTSGGSCGAYSGDKTGYATTTHYYDGQKGACGCGSGDSMASWQANPGSGLYTAAGSQNLFGGSGSWCGSGCGTCYELTNTGSIAADGQGDCTGAGDTITVLVSNLCPANGNEQWCSVPNQFSYPAHFDIMSQDGPQGWNNPVVKYKEVPCPGSLTSDWKTCECANGASSRSRRALMEWPYDIKH